MSRISRVGQPRAPMVVFFLFTSHQGEEGGSKLAKRSLFTLAPWRDHEERFHCSDFNLFDAFGGGSESPGRIPTGFCVVCSLWFLAGICCCFVHGLFLTCRVAALIGLVWEHSIV